MSLPNNTHRILLLAIALGGSVRLARAEIEAGAVEVIASVSEQKMMIVRDGGWLKKYRISTSRFGLGDSFGSYKTPVGRMRVCEKLGDALPAGAVIKHRQATGEVLAANAPGRDPIVSRILWLEGLEAQNEHARARSIYIHGTPEEARLGKPVSWGCIRMRSEDVVELYDLVPLGTVVTILDEDLPHLPKWKPEPPVILAKNIEASPHSASSGPPLRKEEHPTSNIQHPTPNEPAAASRYREVSSPIAELLRRNDARPIPADPGAAASLKGSILFAGLAKAQKRPAKAPADVESNGDGAAENAFVANTTPRFFSVMPPVTAEFSLANTVAVSDLQLVDLRRLTLDLENSWASVFEPRGAPGRLAWLGPAAEQRVIRTLRDLPTTNPTPF